MKRSNPSGVLLWIASLIVGSLLVSAPRGWTQDVGWEQWRGPTRDGQFVGPTWPSSLSDPHLVRRWSLPLGESYSGPLISGDQVFTTETREKRDEVVSAYDRRTGKKLWEASWPGSMKVPFFAAANGSWIRSTPACDDQKIYVGGMRDVLVALDRKTGAEIWRHDFVQDFQTPVPAFGFVSSPLLIGDSLIVQAGGSIVKLHKHSGQIEWRTSENLAGAFNSAFSSPMRVQTNAVDRVFVQTRQALKELDPNDGREIWSYDIPAYRGMNILTPVFTNVGLFTSAYGGKSLMLQVRNQPSAPEVVELWTHKAQGYMSTPVVVGDYLYIHLRNQRFMCLDLRDGTEKWRSQSFGKYCSLIAQGDRILALDERGDLLLLRANPERFELLSERHISDSPTWAHVAMSGNDLVIREQNALTCYRWK